MDDQIGWIVVEFSDDTSIEVVPKFWLKNNSCAWPKASKQAKRYIQKRIKPNTNDFIFFKSRQIGHKVYSSYSEAKKKLPLAIQKSDLSSADEIIDRMRRRKKKYPNRDQSLSPNYTIVKSKKLKVENSKKTILSAESCPPRYNDISQSTNSKEEKNIFDISDDSDSNNDIVYDSDKDPIDKGQKNSNNVIDGVNCLTPEKRQSLLDESIENREQIILSPVGTWTVEPFNNDKQLLYKTSSDRNSIQVKKVLFHDGSIENSAGSVNKACTTASTANTLTQPQDSDILQNQPKITDDFQRFITNTLVNMKYDIGSILSIVQSNSININTLMINKDTSAKNLINLDNIFPIKNHNELESLETKMKDDKNFKNTLVTQLSVLIDINDLGNSVRRIASRMFTDILLSDYSLHGFKSKLCFSSLKSYRVIIDAIRVNVKYTIVPEKEIDNTLGIWLSHAPFRIKNLSRKQEKHQKLI